MITDRSRIAGLLAAVVIGGYALRFHVPVPEVIRDAAGEIAYVVAAALGVLLVRPRATATQAAAGGFMLTCAVEVLQLWQPAWLQAIRATRLGGAALGTTFSWGDFAPYAVGAILACILIALVRSDTT